VFARARATLRRAGGWARCARSAVRSADEAGAFVEALSLGRWLLEAPLLPGVRARTEVADAGWSRHCPSCGRQHFPRTDPAVIVAITSATHPDRLLLGSNALWAGNRFSCFAGFVEAGESLEAAVAREVREEAGVDVVDVTYRGSQAWPYPRSLMLGFLAAAADDAAARPTARRSSQCAGSTRPRSAPGSPARATCCCRDAHRSPTA
jgi:NAD+ diphosphatase